MVIFKKPEAAPVDNGNGKPQTQLSRWLQQIEHSLAIEKHVTAMQQLNDVDNFDLQKVADFTRRRREQITNAIQESGGTVEPESIEQELKNFIPRALQRAPEE